MDNEQIRAIEKAARYANNPWPSNGEVRAFRDIATPHAVLELIAMVEAGNPASVRATEAKPSASAAPGISLPPPAFTQHRLGADDLDYFTADQMRAAIAAAREEARKEENARLKVLLGEFAGQALQAESVAAELRARLAASDGDLISSGALRQFRHNDSDDMVFAYDKEITDREFAFLYAKAYPSFEGEEDILAWLDSLHGTVNGTNTVTNAKSPTAQRIINLVRANPEAKAPQQPPAGEDVAVEKAWKRFESAVGKDSGDVIGLLDAEEIAALRRFDETCQDGEGYDVEKSMMKRLAEIGVIRRTGGAWHEITEFGNYVLDHAPK